VKLTPGTVEEAVMMDQATVLRGLVEGRHETPTFAGSQVRPPSTPPTIRPLKPLRAGTTSRCRTLAITSGKGGVGKSCLALNLAVALAKQGRKVCLLDANLGLGNIDLMCGLNGYWNLAHVVTGTRRLDEVVLQGPAGIHVVPGAGGLDELADCPSSVQDEVLGRLSELEAGHDHLLIDTGTGMHRGVRSFTAAAEQVLVITTPEPTAIADAYATIKSTCSLATAPQPLVLVNQAHDALAARDILHRIQETARSFLRREIHSAGFIPFDPVVPRSIVDRVPFVLAAPHAPASRSIEQLARRLVSDPEWTQDLPATETDSALASRVASFFARLKLGSRRGS
jgi:flagellar biosynthesis protein FlhG